MEKQWHQSNWLQKHPKVGENVRLQDGEQSTDKLEFSISIHVNYMKLPSKYEVFKNVVSITFYIMPENNQSGIFLSWDMPSTCGFMSKISKIFVQEVLKLIHVRYVDLRTSARVIMVHFLFRRILVVHWFAKTRKVKDMYYPE